MPKRKEDVGETATESGKMDGRTGILKEGIVLAEKKETD